MKKLSASSIGLIIFLWLIDVSSKFAVYKYLSDGSILNVLGDLLRFRLVYNTGGVFGIFQGNATLFHIMSGIAIIVLFVYYLKSPYQDTPFVVAVCLILGGALGNFTDRFFISGVVDFIDMGFGAYRWPTYNMADVWLFFGAVTLMIYFYKVEKLEQAGKKST